MRALLGAAGHRRRHCLLLFLWRARPELQRVYATFPSHLVLHEGVDHAVSRRLHLATESFRYDVDPVAESERKPICV